MSGPLYIDIVKYFTTVIQFLDNWERVLDNWQLNKHRIDSVDYLLEGEDYVSSRIIQLLIYFNLFVKYLMSGYVSPVDCLTV